MAIRPAHTVSIIQKRLKQAESSDVIDAMELIGIFDELSRVERKWLEKAEEAKSGADQRRTIMRPLSDATQMNERFDRLARLMESALRRGVPNAAEQPFLQKCVESLRQRKPLPNSPPQ